MNLWAKASLFGVATGGLLSFLLATTSSSDRVGSILVYASIPGIMAAGGPHNASAWGIAVGNIVFYTVLAYAVLRFLAYRKARRIVGPT